MRRICTLILAAGLVFGAVTGASAIDFNAKGQWLMGFAGGEHGLLSQTRDAGAQKQKVNNGDNFRAAQRVRLQLDAVASEALSGTVYFEIGTQNWGVASQGGALGADGTNQIKVKRAYIDWAVPDTDAKVRMGIQGVTMPNAAGGSAVMDTDVAGVTAAYQFNENVGLTALWARPINDNFVNNRPGYTREHTGYLDNIDLFSLMLPLTFEGVKATPWAMYGMIGRNALKTTWDGTQWDSPSTADGNLPYSLRPYPALGATNAGIGSTNKQYVGAFWAGLPVQLTLWDPLNIEIDVNYGWTEGMGRFDYSNRQGFVRRGSTERQGWLAKGLVEYKMDWATPGVFGWYASGDIGNPKDGSQRMPSLVPMGNFTSYLGDGNYGWMLQDYGVDYAGTWGVGAQLKDLSFVENLSHTFRAAYWGGTNSPSMVKYMDSAYSWNDGLGGGTGPYLTTNDGLVEFNLVNSYKMYENFDVNLEGDYIVNCMDNSTWKKAHGGSFEKQDMWKVQATFAYSF
ncbi:MAG: outer membrane homotrimeric porin [Desulfovibrio sp.]|nr:outer membrane homotrimeric porin [Desulfovibrio sp.]